MHEKQEIELNVFFQENPLLYSQLWVVHLHLWLLRKFYLVPYWDQVTYKSPQLEKGAHKSKIRDRK